jgi:hypothetical protein
MVTQQMIENFLAQKKIAVVGVSRDKHKFGTAIFNELRKAGYTAYPINPALSTIDGVQCFPTLSALPEPVDTAVFVVPPAVTDKVAKEAISLNYKRLWMQQGSASDTAIAECTAKGIDVVHGHCVLMFLGEGKEFPHSLHKWFVKLFGRLPK